MSELLDSIVLPIEDLLFIKVVHNGKKPAEKHGFKDGKTGFDIVRTLALGYNVGFVMEPHFVAIDMDEDIQKGYEGIKVIKELEKELGKLPATYTQRTPRGGLHKVFLAKNFKSKPRGKITPAVDIKYSGIILFHGSCIDGRYYQAIDGVPETGKLLFSALPQTWLDYITKDTTNISKQATQKEYSPTKPKIYCNIDVEKMFNGCKFLMYCKDNSETLSEPEWFSMVSILAQIEHSDELIHTLSEPYPKYSFEETQRKIENARKFGHPHSCRYISGNYPEICKDCNNVTNERI